eukprot:15446473-Alexandrium_andersonii.AAC.1
MEHVLPNGSRLRVLARPLVVAMCSASFVRRPLPGRRGSSRKAHRAIQVGGVTMQRRSSASGAGVVCDARPACAQ